MYFEREFAGGERAGLVHANNGGGAQRLHARQALHQHALATEPQRGEGQE